MNLRVEPARLGGATGRHARIQGIFFDPAPWLILMATLLWALRMGHQSLCQQDNPDEPVKTMLRLCYSDVPIIWQTNQLGTGATATGENGLPQAPIVSLFIALGRAITGFIVPISPTASPQQTLDSGNVFVVVNAVLLFCFFLTWVMAHMLMGRTSTVGTTRTATGRLEKPPARSWDGAYIALSVGVFTVGLVNWDLIAPALTACALLAWAWGRPVLAGVLTGIALGAGISPLALVIAVAVVCLRSGALDALARYAIATLASLSVILVGGLLASPSAVRRSYLGLLDPDAGLGSLWWILTDAGLASSLVPGLSKLLIAVGVGAVVLFCFQVPARPRVAQVAALVLLLGLMLAPTYSPQYVLWSLGMVALARPKLRDWFLFSLTEALYWAAVWGHLQGNLRLGTGDDMAYPLAIIVRLAGAGWIIWQITGDMLRPWADPVRVGTVDDPQGGVVDLAPDAAWMSVPPAEHATPAGRS
ncbi:hypothetical protein ACPCG0_13695 [Propionibacteriaceae bacterium Y1923]